MPQWPLRIGAAGLLDAAPENGWSPPGGRIGPAIRSAVKKRSLQDHDARRNRCFGCGTANEKALRIKSFVEGEVARCGWRPEPHRLAFDGVLNGRICGAVLDCHSAWAAVRHLIQKAGAKGPPFTVPADSHVRLERPIPMDMPLHLTARVVESFEDRAVVEATLEAGGPMTTTCRGTFAAVPKGHPAFHPW